MGTTIESIGKTRKSVEHIGTETRLGNYIDRDLGIAINRVAMQSEHLQETSRALLENAVGLLKTLKKALRSSVT